MKVKKLFRVLVIGGSMITASAGCDAETGNPSTMPGDGSLMMTALDSGSLSDAASLSMSDHDAASPMTAQDAGSTPSATDAGAMECFCPSEECCETNAAGESVVREGMTCCWSSSC